MRAYLLFLALAAAAACAQPAPPQCNLSFDREVAFTRPDAADIVTVRTFGESCDLTVGLFTVSEADGNPIWAWAGPLHQTYGAALAGANEESMQEFLERWSQPTIATTSAAPPWPLPEHARTSFDRLTYEDIRARNLPMLCHSSGTTTEVCVFWEPAAAGAGRLFDRDVREQGGTG